MGLLIIFVFFVFPINVNAQVVINEVFANPSGPSNEPTEFIELYNSSDVEVDLNGFTLSENKSYEIKNLVLPPFGYLSFERSTTGLALNNSGDTVTLSDTNNNVVDTFSYTESIEDKSWSRVPDGNGEFVNNTDISFNLPNNAPPTPTPTVAPSATLAPTIKVQKPLPTNKPEPTKAFVSPTPEVETEVLAISDEESEDLISDEKQKRQEEFVVETVVQNGGIIEEDEEVEKFAKDSIYIIIGGICLLASSVFYYVKSRNEKVVE